MNRRGRAPAVLLISPGILKWTDMDFGLPHLVSIGGYLREHLGVRVEILDLNYEGGDHRHLERTLEALGPFLMVGLSCYSSFDYMRVLTLARFLRRLLPDTPLVTGGYHASALPHDLLFDGSPFDAVVRGEGERSMKSLVENLLGGGRVERGIVEQDVVPGLDALPPYAWDLLDRYWPRAQSIGRKFQIYLSRGCPYHCTFCMERAKSGYSWRAFSPERALDELRRLARRTDLGGWVVNIADPLFGLQRSWRRAVLEGIVREGIRPRQFWTLTRADDLLDEDVSLLARARFSIGIGAESGSPAMLRIMQKGNTPGKYLAALERLMALSRKHGLNWAANIIVGHPGETLETMRETHAFLTRLYTSAPDTCGWLSIDPFRLYPGALVHEQMDAWSATHGAVFHHPEWWKSWYDGPFRAEHVDPSASLDFEGRVRFMFEAYAPLVRDILARFRGQGRSVDRVFERSLAEQAQLMSPRQRDAQLARARHDRVVGPRPPTPILRSVDPGRCAESDAPAAVLRFPIGLRVRDPAVRRREAGVRLLLESGVLRTEAVVEAVLDVAPDRYLAEDAVGALYRGGLRLLALALEALGPGAGERAAVLHASDGYHAALLSRLVGEAGEVVAMSPGGRLRRMKLQARLADLANVRVAGGDGTTGAGLPRGVFDVLWLDGGLPRWPRGLRALMHPELGRAATYLGPRFRPMDLVCLTREGEALRERRLAVASSVPLRGAAGWVR